MRALTIEVKDSDLILKNLLDNGALLLDVRTNHEFAGFHLPKAYNIRPEELSRQINRIKNWKKPIIVYSTYGLRSRLAHHILEGYGIEVYDANSQLRVMSLLQEFNQPK